MSPDDPPDRRCNEPQAAYAALEQLPEHLTGEIIDGVLIATPRPSPRHALTHSALGMKVGPPFHMGDGGPGGWWILIEPELRIAGSVVVPDLAGWRRENLPALPETAWFAQAPDWACEVLSPGTERLDRASKLPLFASWGVAHVWLADPRCRTLEVFRLEPGGYLLLAVFTDQTDARAKPFHEVPMDLTAVWGG